MLNRAKQLSIFLAVLWAAFTAGYSFAQGEFYAFETAQQEQMFNELTRELRCPKCQNQSISDSDAPLAQDMRQLVYQMVMEGQSREQIIDFMKVRYGDFVHYQPPFQNSTMILWLGPIAVILIGILVIYFQAQGNKRQCANIEAEDLTPEEEQKINAILKNNADNSVSQASNTNEERT
ncbi:MULTISPECIES: cytochrome c-type biogenesis protein [Gammaproteobacteria]|uniref:cytochrome c-type biogenesis protein n=1 Tax=Gammaproteobacteria TaxID=1236 RepID=UPI000DD07249|nr:MULTISPECIES: cytochrome c-type biogenesis protein [Gammaproteobacteria]RTE86111.1 cytochrome c-type biogenesis protein CcmH [Aliidiomarina sp. B3213]TCZ91464.1 cytochrome c-type biogenesis protein CcmH [Lysobacter sp. N42]